MVLPVSPNPITLANIQTEFGGANPVSLSEYYAGGTYVAAATNGFPGGVSTAIPTSGAISLGSFHGATAVVVPNVAMLANQIVSGGDFNSSGGYNSRGDYFLEVDGDLAQAINNSSTSQGTRTTRSTDWVDAKPVTSSDFEYNVSYVAGSSGMMGTTIHGDTTTWTDFTVELHFYATNTAEGPEETAVDLQIREKGNITNIDTSRINISLENGGGGG